MRVLLGMIIGAMLVVGGAYISDSTGPGSATTAAEHRPMVNWNVVSENFTMARKRANEVWNKLSQKVTS